MPNAHAFDATSAPSPPDDPPLMKAGLCGLKTVPKRGLVD
jgi:hypothetical protein